MLLGTLILLLLSYSITSRRDKSIFHSRAMMTILLSIIVNLSYFILIFVFLMVLVPNLVTILFSFALTVMKTMISNLSPIQLIDQLKRYYYINPIIALSLGITLFSFAGIPPLIGFFGKQMILNQIQSYLGKLCTF
jgi:flagellar biosynthesis protein FlhB